MTESVTTDKQSPSGAFRTVGTGAPSADTRPVEDDDRAVIAVFGDLDDAQDAVERLATAGLVQDGSYLVVVHGGKDEVARAQQILSESGSSDVQRHDAYRGPTDRMGLTEIERVEGSTVHLAVPEDALLPAGELARSAG